MSGRCFQDSSANGPRKMDGNVVITQCFDCSRTGKCRFQNRSRWPATTIAEGCPLPAAPEEEEKGVMPMELPRQDRHTPAG